jgi:hypothetical protein
MNFFLISLLLSQLFLGCASQSSQSVSNKSDTLSSSVVKKEVGKKEIDKNNQVPGVNYNRKKFKHWVDEDKNCRNTRHEILFARSLEEVTFKKEKKKNKKNCYVLSGLWEDYYYPEHLTRSKDVDIDHIVPLKHAWDLGAWQWSAQKRQEFANDPLNLAVTHKKYNRQKGPKSILDWLPVHKNYACRYQLDWLNVKEKYLLPISQDEKEVVSCP